MSRMFSRSAAAIAALVVVAWGQPSAPAVADWPPITFETRPWTRWWWLGSAVDEAGLTSELEALRAAGLGGVEITPIYGAAGAESRFVPFLSARWMELLEHTVREAQRVGLGVDMATGTGWPFGGPWVVESDACRSLMFKTWTVEGGAQLAEPVRLMQTPLVRALGNQVYEVREISPGESTPAGTSQQPLLRSSARVIQIGDLKDPVEANANLQALALEQVRYPKPAPLLALVAYPRSGEPVDLTSRVDAQGTLQWVAPPGAWTLHAAFLGWHGKLVERAAPGGEGNVIDHFSRDAIRRYLAAFDKGFGGFEAPRPARLLQRFVRSGRRDRSGGWDAGAARGVPAAARVRSARASAGVGGKRGLPRARGLPGDRVGPAARDLYVRVERLGEEARPHRAQPGARIARQPARPLRGQRYPRDGRERSAAVQVGDVRGARCRTPARLGGGCDVAGGALQVDSCRRPRRRRQVLRRRRQPHRLSRHRVLAARGAVARVAVLRVGRVQPAERVVDRLLRAERLRDARAVISPGGRTGPGRAAVLPVSRRAGHRVRPA